MMSGRSTWLHVSVAALAAALLAGCGGTPAGTPATGSALEKPHLTIGLSVPGATYLPLYVAVDEGTFAKQGIQADLVEFRGGADLIKAAVSGSVTRASSWLMIRMDVSGWLTVTRVCLQVSRDFSA